MGFNIAGLGAVATGIQRGMDAGQDRRLRETEAGYRAEEMGRRRKKWKTEDDELALDQQANEAAQRVIAEDMKANQSQPGLAPQGVPQAPAPMAPPMNATQADASMGAEGYGPSSATPQSPGLGDAAPMGQPAQPKPYRPSQTVALRAAQARSDAYLNAGRVDKWQKHWSEDAGFRYSLRRSTVAPLKAALAQGGDISEALKAFDDTLDNGSELVSATPTQDGKGYSLEYANKKTGKRDKKDVSAADIGGMVDRIMQDPAKAEEQSAQMKLEAFKRGSAAIENRQKHKDALELAGTNNASREKVAKITGDSREAVAETRVDGSADVARIRSAGGGGKGGGKAADTADIRALKERRVAVDNEMNRIARMLPTVNSTERTGLQAQMKVAQERMTEIDGQLSAIAKRGQGGGLADVAPAGAATGPTATNPKTGEKLILKGGKWVPLQ